MSARDDVLAWVRTALGRDGTASAGPVDVPRDYRTTGDAAPGSEEALALLSDRLVDYRAQVHRAASDADVAAVVAEVLTVAGVREVVVPPALPPGWTDALPDEVRVVVDDPDAPRTAEQLDAADAVVTGARVAIADTGTVVLDGAPDQGRRALSLVPDLHVCVVRTADVVASVPEAVRLLAAHPERPQTWVSGPSATSDIELSRVEGVHGPRTLHVVLVG